MTVTATSLASRLGRSSSRRRFHRRRGRDAAVPVICPYLIAEDGAWRSARPSREHHCGAVTPATQLALDKQRRLCLAKAHATCPTQLAALAEYAGTSAAPLVEPRDAVVAAKPGGATRWSLVRTVPVVLDDPARSLWVGRRPPRAAQWALAGLMALALGAVVLARLPDTVPDASGPTAVLGATGQPAAAAAGLTSATPPPRGGVATPIRSPAQARPSPTTSVRASGPQSAAAAPTEPAVHVVVPGDTLSALARAHATTVEALQAANGLGDSTTLLIGQELKLP